MKKIFSLTVALWTISVNGQNIKGTVLEKTNEGLETSLVGASVYWAGTTHGTITDINGKFDLSRHLEGTKLVVSYVGFLNDTLGVNGLNFVRVVLKPSRLLEEVQVVGKTSSIDFQNPIKTELISSAELLKAACCNLSESFDTNASVDVSFTDAVSGAKQIQLLGLDGTYTQIMTENIPSIRGLANNYGLSYIPGTWVGSIDVGKGAGSVVNGYESMTGQINVELIKPEQEKESLLNLYGNGLGRLEGNFVTSKKLSDKWSTGLSLHGSNLSSEVDRNNDGFRDTPMFTQLNVLSRFKYNGDRYKAQFGLKVLDESRKGGQSGFETKSKTPTLYGTDIQTQRLEVFAKNGVIFPKTPYRGLGFITSATFHNQEAVFGNNIYKGEQNTFYANLIYQSIIGNTNHKLRSGISYILDSYDETLNDSTFSRKESVPGIFSEYTFSGLDQLSLVAGVRADYHSIHNVIVTPRVHIKYDLPNDLSLRLSAGRGFRTPNFIGENLSLLASSRRLIVEEVLLPEESWNYGISLNKEYFVKDRILGLDLEFFRTEFINQLIIDRDRDASLLLFYNLDGRSYANSFKVEANYELNDHFDLKMAYKYYDVKSTISGKLRRVAFQAKDRLFLNLVYASNFDKWKVDLTSHWFGKQRLPSLTSDIDGVERMSSQVLTINAQVTKAFRKWDAYVGVENMTNYRQKDAIVGSNNPFGSSFDATMIWGPIVGRNIYTGIRYTFEK